MLEDIVDDQIVRGHEGLDAVALRSGIFGAVEVRVSNLRSRGLVQPDVVSVGIQGLDVLHPAGIAVAKLNVGHGGGAIVRRIYRQRLDPDHRSDV